MYIKSPRIDEEYVGENVPREYSQEKNIPRRRTFPGEFHIGFLYSQLLISSQSSVTFLEVCPTLHPLACLYSP
jgi:hypothetical protein